ncbi:hypothetical protein [Vibrio cincinnatiensis]|uniref:hypothetical protein n=1 Tax=Vibrio cincinnatiensis TaxID=675 RepID=UPI001EE145B2|nr:hypothetical protein [Vibrio cincinnatiensis]MCG3727302.1 hypothetical protein [Vibrio cincinnatiensis]
MQKKLISVNKLLLDLNNPRFSNAPDNQRDAIKEMVNIQSSKLAVLAQDIIDFGLDPSASLIVVKDEDGRLIVAEGNRRLTTLKLLHNPDIIPENATTKKIKSLLSTNPDLPTKVDCVVYEFGDDDYEHWVSLLHSGQNNGRGRVEWSSQEKETYDARHGNGSFQHQLLAFIKQEESISSSIKSNVSQLSITNISRLTGDPYVRECLGINPPSQGILFCYTPKDILVNKINKLASVMLERDDKGKPEFTVDRIRHKKDRSDFMAQLEFYPVEQKLEKPWKVNKPHSYIPTSISSEGTNSQLTIESSQHQESQTPTVQSETDRVVPSEAEKSNKDNQDATNTKRTENKSKNLSPNRRMLVPLSVKLTIPNTKINEVFKELKNRLNFDEHPYSISVMFRVFIELSLGHYIEKNKITLTDKKSGLSDKVIIVSEHLRQAGKINSAEDKTIKAVSGTNFKREGAIQQYIHNPSMHPDKPALNILWTNLEPLFRGVWS